MKAILFYCALLAHFVLFSQVVISGQLIDRESKEPIPFANVFLTDDLEHLIGTTTNFDGNFQLSSVAAGTYDLNFSFIGYTSKKLSIEIFSTDLEIQETMEVGILLEEVVIQTYTMPLFTGSSWGPCTRVREEIERFRCFSCCSFNDSLLTDSIELLEHEKLKRTPNLTVFPNPGLAENLKLNYFNLDAAANNKVQILIFDVLGKRVMARHKMLQNGRLNIRLTDLQGLKSGNYFVQIKDQSTILTQKVTIQ